MKADVQPWSKTPATHLDPCGWDSSPCRGPRETMLELNPAPRPLRAQLDFFQKLGYSTAQIQAAQKKFGTDTDKVLGELVRVGTGQDSEQGPVTTVSVLVPGGAPQAGGPELQLPVSGEDGDALRAVVIDGSNVAMSHGNKEVFSCLGIQLAVNFFLNRGHLDVTVFVPSWRKEQPRPDVPITDQHILRELEKKKVLVFTPSRRVAGKRVVCNDDCFIVKHAYESDGVVVSNDMYRDLQGVNPDWKRFIEERLLMYSFVNNKFMLPDDPLGRHGPTLENFLRKVPKTQRRQPCPYGRKCTYGIKCRFHHPERTKQSTEQNTEQNQALTRCSPVSEPSLGLVEDMPKKLSLKNKSVPVGQGKQSHRSGRRSQTRKKVDSQQSDSVSVRDRTSRETGTLDSGLGSMETMWSLSNQPYGPSYGSVQQQFCPPSSPSSSPFQPPSSDLSPFGSPPYPSCCTFPISWPAFSQPSSRLHPSQQIWSDPFCVCPSETRSQPGERSLWDPPADPSRKEREVVRKKLLAIFSAQLVDEAMDMSPNQLDPQRLVAKILELQNQHQSLR